MINIVTKSENNKESRIRRIHKSGWRLAFALTGGGSKVISDLLSIPGGSNSFLEAVVPYSQESLIQYLGRTPEQFCADLTARQLAMTAFNRALALTASDASPKNALDTSSLQSDLLVKEESVSLSGMTGKFDRLIGVGVTASLASDRPKKGEHRVFVAFQSACQTWSLELKLKKGERTRTEEEIVVAEFVLSSIECFLFFFQNFFSESVSSENPIDENTKQYLKKGATNVKNKTIDIINSFGNKQKNNKNIGFDFKLATELIVLDLSESRVNPLTYWPELTPFLLENEKVTGKVAIAGAAWMNLLFQNEETSNKEKSDCESVEAILCRSDSFECFIKNKETVYFSKDTRLVFAGSFAPLHRGHEKMIEIAEEHFQHPVELEISVRNVDKAPLDFLEVATRLAGIRSSSSIGDIPVWFTRYPKFVDKTGFFKDQKFIVGTDTLRRISDPKYDGSSLEIHRQVIQELLEHGVHFIHFIRKQNGVARCLNELTLDQELKDNCTEIPVDEFLDDISSSELRRNCRSREAEKE